MSNSYHNNDSIHINMDESDDNQAPVWNKKFIKVKQILSTISTSSLKLDQLYSEYLKPSFGNDKKEIKKNIDFELNLIKEKYGVSKNIIQELENYNNKNNTTVIFIMINNSIQVLKNDFHASYRKLIEKNQNFINNCKKRESIINEFNDKFNTDDYCEDEYNSSIMKSYDNEIEARDKLIDQRGNEINELAKDIIELNELMLNFNEYVNHNGELLDRIEINIEESSNNVSKGNENLESAETYQSGGNKCKIIIIIIIGVIIITLLLAFIIYLKFFLRLL